jgi:NAD(P)H-hydrate epimerase
MIPKKRAENAYKNQFGRVVVIGGSFKMSGAAQLSTAAVLRAGAGLTVLASTRDVINRVGGAIPEAMFATLEADNDGFFSGDDSDKIAELAENADVLLFGNGVGKTAGTRKILKAVLRTDVHIKIIDADGINLIADDIQLLKEAKGTTVLTPHEGELARLFGAKIIDRAEAAQSIFDEYGAIIVAKGVPTYICADETTAVYAGNPGLAKGGSGDVLAGIIAAFTAGEFAPSALISDGQNEVSSRLEIGRAHV